MAEPVIKEYNQVTFDAIADGPIPDSPRFVPWGWTDTIVRTTRPCTKEEYDAMCRPDEERLNQNDGYLISEDDERKTE